MILGIGLDLCETARIGRAIERPRFLQRVFTPAERARILAASGQRRAEIAAGLFACKEAAAKALGTGFSGFGPADVEFVPDSCGRPVAALHRGAKSRAVALAGGGWRMWVTITHEAGLAAATAVLEGDSVP